MSLHNLSSLSREIAALWAAVRTPVARSRVADDVWVKLTAATLETAGIWIYTVEVWRDPINGVATDTGRLARNAFEIGNTSSVQGGYAISSGSCAITGIEPAPLGKFYKVQSGVPVSGKMTYLFEHKNDPTISSGGGGGGGGSSLGFS